VFGSEPMVSLRPRALDEFGRGEITRFGRFSVVELLLPWDRGGRRAFRTMAIRRHSGRVVRGLCVALDGLYPGQGVFHAARLDH
jgi:hypothetical protein